MPVSPLCEVKDGAGSYQSTANGVDVTPANTVTIHLIDTSADTWSIQCVYTDDESVAATVTASLSINPTLRTATFTAPVAGRTYILESRVNGGVDQNGRAKASYVTTFGVYTLTGGNRVLAANETTEGGPFGWIVPVNSFIRNGVVGGGTITMGGASPNNVDWSAGETFSKTLSAGSNTLTFSNNASGVSISVALTGAASTVTWPAGIKWSGGVAPTQTASGLDIYTFIQFGSTIVGSVVPVS